MMVPTPRLPPFGPTLTGAHIRRVPWPDPRYRAGLGATTADLAQAIARFEGACGSGGSCTNNNPGNLRTPGSGAWAGQVGVDARGFAVFATPEDGWAALDSQINTNINRGLTLSEFFGGKPGVYAGYAPAADSNNPGAYSTTVAGWLGIDNTVPLAQALDYGGSLDYAGAGEGDGMGTGTGTGGTGVTGGAAGSGAGLDLPTLVALAGGVVVLALVVSG